MFYLLYNDINMRTTNIYTHILHLSLTQGICTMYSQNLPHTKEVVRETLLTHRKVHNLLADHNR